MEQTLTFTQKRLHQISCPPGKRRAYFQDKANPYLQLQVTSKGAKSFYCRCWNRSKRYTERTYIGKVEITDLDDARSRALELASVAIREKAPRDAIQPKQNDPTFAEAYEAFMKAPVKRKKKGVRREATIKTYEMQYRCHLENTFGPMSLKRITASEVDDFHTQIGEENGKYAANRLVTLISGVFNDAKSKGWDGSNPATGIEKYVEKRRVRFLDEHELGPFLRACETERQEGSPTLADAVLAALFTGLRRRNVCAAHWRHIDLDQDSWTIPGLQMKNGELHRVYLCSYLKTLIVQRFTNRTCEEWVFPGNSRTGHLMEPKRGLARIAKRAQIDPVNIHCLKHTFMTYADDLGLPSAVRKRLAAHKGNGDVTDGYTHARESRVREAYEKVTAHMLKIAGHSPVIS